MEHAATAPLPLSGTGGAWGSTGSGSGAPAAALYGGGMERTARTAQRTLDALVAVVFTLLFALPSVVVAAYTDVVPSVPMWTALVVAACFVAAVWTMRRRPGLALALAWAGSSIQMLAGMTPLPVDAAVYGVLYAAGASSSRRLRWLGFASAIAGALVATAYLGIPSLGDPLSTGLVIGVALFLVAALVGFLLAWTFGLLGHLVRRAGEERARAAAAEREAIAEQERGRIAREMHDIVAHSLAVVVAQSDGARYRAESDPEAATRALTTISAVARGALADVRVLLTRLRHEQGELPQPGLDALDALVARVRASGLEVREAIAAPPEGVPGSVQLAVYRIVQESLTNALRHADRSSPVRLVVGWSTDGVRVETRSALRPGAAVGDPGHGLLGIRERARLVGGTADARVDGAEFVVSAVIPVSSREPDS